MPQNEWFRGVESGIISFETGTSLHIVGIYRDTVVATFFLRAGDSEGDLSFNTGGWDSVTTRLRMNQFSWMLRLPARVHRVRGQTCVTVNNRTEPMSSGIFHVSIAHPMPASTFLTRLQYAKTHESVQWIHQPTATTRRPRWAQRYTAINPPVVAAPRRPQVGDTVLVSRITGIPPMAVSNQFYCGQPQVVTSVRDNHAITFQSGAYTWVVAPEDYIFPAPGRARPVEGDWVLVNRIHHGAGEQTNARHAGRIWRVASTLDSPFAVRIAGIPDDDHSGVWYVSEENYTFPVPRVPRGHVSPAAPVEMPAKKSPIIIHCNTRAEGG